MVKILWRKRGLKTPIVFLKFTSASSTQRPLWPPRPPTKWIGSVWSNENIRNGVSGPRLLHKISRIFQSDPSLYHLTWNLLTVLVIMIVLGFLTPNLILKRRWGFPGHVYLIKFQGFFNQVHSHETWLETCWRCHSSLEILLTEIKSPRDVIGTRL